MEGKHKRLLYIRLILSSYTEKEEKQIEVQRFSLSPFRETLQCLYSDWLMAINTKMDADSNHIK